MQSKKGKVDSSKALDASLVGKKYSGTNSDKHDTSSRFGNDTHAEDVDIKPVNGKEPMAKVDSSKALDASLVVKKYSGTNSDKQDTSSRFGNDTHAEDVDIKPVNDKEPMAKVDRNCTPDSTNMCHRGGEIDHNAKKIQVSCPLLDPSFDNMTTGFLNQSLKLRFKKKVFANVALKNELRKLKGNSVDTDFAKASILGKPVLQPPRNPSVIRQPNAFKSKRPNFSKPGFASQVDVNKVLSKPVTPHYFPKVRESMFVKPHHVIASSSSRNSLKESYGSNDMAHNYYLEEAKKKKKEKNMNLKRSVMHTTSLQKTTNGSKRKPNEQQ
nr:hypothetical protein [Tanacetum cinerariifolium]